MNKFMKKLMKKDGFTLVELIVVIAILAILAGVAVPAYSGYLKKAEASTDITTLEAVQTAALAAGSLNAISGEVVITVDEDKAISEVTVKDIVVYSTDPKVEQTKIMKDFSDLISGTKLTLKTFQNQIVAEDNNGDWAGDCDHVDANKDHKCDRTGCDAAVGEHKAAEGSTTCTYCGQPVA